MAYDDKQDTMQFASDHQNSTDIPSTPSSERLTARLLTAFGLAETTIPDHPSMQVLALFLEQGTLEEQTAAARKLGELGWQEAVDPLVTTLKHNGDARVRAVAGHALGYLAAYTPVDPLLDALADDDAYVRAAAIWALGQLKERLPDEAILPLFAALSDEDEDTYVRVAALRALENLENRIPLEWLTNALKDSAWQIRHLAATILGEQADRVPVEALRNLLEDESELVCIAAVHALGRSGNTFQGGLLPLFMSMRRHGPEST